MGTMIQGTCSGCGYKATLFVGGGLRDCNPETALEISGSDPDLANALQNRCRFSIDRVPALCPACKKLVTAAVITYEAADGSEHTINAPCPDCGRILALYPPEAERVGCPVCRKMFRLEPAGHWD